MICTLICKYHEVSRRYFVSLRNNIKIRISQSHHEIWTDNNESRIISDCFYHELSVTKILMKSRMIFFLNKK